MLSRKEIEAIDGIPYDSDSLDNSEDEATNNVAASSMDGHMTAVPKSSSKCPPPSKKMKATPSAARPQICDRDQHQRLGETETDLGLRRTLDGSAPRRVLYISGWHFGCGSIEPHNALKGSKVPHR